MSESSPSPSGDNGTVTSTDVPNKYPDQGTKSGNPKIITVKPEEKK